MLSPESSLLIQTFFMTVVGLSLKATPIMLALILLRKMLKKYTTPGARHMLWMCLALVLLLPFGYAVDLPARLIPQFESLRSVQSPASPNTLVSTRKMLGEAATVNTVSHTESARSEVGSAPSNLLVSSLALNTFSVIWLGGVLMCFTLVLISGIRLSYRCRLSRPIDSWLNKLVTDCQQTLGYSSRLQVCIQNQIRSPMLVGVFRPTLLLPASLCFEENQAQLRHIVLHELSHAKRKDILAQYLFTAGLFCHWFNPLLWLARRYMIEDMESACDASATSALSAQQRKNYGQTLIDLSEALPSQPYLPIGVGILEKHRHLVDRLAVIRSQPVLTKTGKFLFAGIFLLAVGAAATNLKVTQPPISEPTYSARILPLSQLAELIRPNFITPVVVETRIENVKVKIEAPIAQLDFGALLREIRQEGFTAIKKEQSLMIIEERSARRHTLPLMTEDSGFETHEWVTAILPYESDCTLSLTGKLRKIVPRHGHLTTYRWGEGEFIVTTTVEVVRQVKNAIANIDNHFNLTGKCELP